VLLNNGSVSSDLLVELGSLLGIFSGFHLGTEDGFERDTNLRKDFLLIHKLGSQVHSGQVLGVGLEAFTDRSGVFGELSGTSGDHLGHTVRCRLLDTTMVVGMLGVKRVSPRLV
jgi:hypothetical protein